MVPYKSCFCIAACHSHFQRRFFAAIFFRVAHGEQRLGIFAVAFVPFLREGKGFNNNLIILSAVSGHEIKIDIPLYAPFGAG